MSARVVAALLRTYTGGSLSVLGLRDALWEQVWAWTPGNTGPATAELITDWRAALDVQLLLTLEPLDQHLTREPKGCEYDTAAAPCVRCRAFFDALDLALVTTALEIVHAVPARAAGLMGAGA